MPKDRDQQTPVEPEDEERLERHRGQGTAGTGEDLLPSERRGVPEEIELTSPAFEDGDSIPRQYTPDGDDTTPPLEWSGVPDDAAELALLCEDPDAPQGTVAHWVLAGIHPSTTGIAEGVGRPAGAVEGTNDHGQTGWRGPSPPPGDGPHRYIFTLSATSEPLDLPPGATADDLHTALAGKELARGELVGTYER